jgi:hypothetical protein
MLFRPAPPFQSASNINHIGVSGFIPPGAPNFHQVEQNCELRVAANEIGECLRKSLPTEMISAAICTGSYALM